MAEPIYKFLLFIKRREGMTPAEFEHYYENVHSKMGKEIVPDVGAFKYVRRYIHPLAGSLDSRADDLEYDEITEVWFKDYEKFKAVAEKVSTGILPPGVAEDEAKFMDRSKTRFATVVEYEHNF